jgi:hypothetical protein
LPAEPGLDGDALDVADPTGAVEMQQAPLYDGRVGDDEAAGLP